MCGIVGYLGAQQAMPLLLEGLKRLEYRGYDSAGMAVIGNNGLEIRRSLGKLKELDKLLQESPLSGTMGIGHTRWATHGRPSETNAHPHQVGHIAVVHNGIIENYLELKQSLIQEGHSFSSETDTEIVSQLIYKYSCRGADFVQAVQLALKEIRGSFALVVINAREPRTLIATRKESPLILGLANGEYFVASDIPAILHHTRQVVFLEDHDLVILKDGGFTLEGQDGQPVKRPVITITWSPAMAEKAGYKHFMQKEIFEQPRALIDTFRTRIDPDQGEIFLEEFKLADKDLQQLKKITLVACGTSYHAGLVGKFLLEDMCRLPVEVDLGSEFRYRNPFVDPHTLLIPISQSGETADTLAGLKEGKAKGARTMAICNVVGSSIARESENVFYTHAGPEIGVASTKAFTTQLVALFLISLFLARRLGRQTQDQVREQLANLLKLPTLVQEVLDYDQKLREIGQRYVHAQDFLYLGRGIHYPIALEGALKLKEISYVHAEGYPAGEMKHGPIALIDEHLPVVVLATRGPVFDKMMANIEEVVARRGRVIALSEADNYPVYEKVETLIPVPETTLALSPILLVVPLQLLAYHIADLRGTDVDQPRNLAKSVTVE
ncbi:MAG: glutamine--fructose-6-phosphate transaminase (isomerizing) [Deltaproteobacteria bacterium]|nr:glutamine--fructose-6-phosphate transaminase (isomerizing) [Deltaproteobacteria bacterium]MBW1951723.1 glutamine--fructose-6-phosphate transaminase (isomerizing) [Deltaproteobacteria bacterium]MBW1987255.1 glutamine--fructose-6-phosphate transaminase (isomerizing) [Deltaproteobacteria bacterium]MBW2134736.1 glutamine--fructose-6-phosphate transaminase (isomerizing) [Deltaproteobacteria bacterium]